MKGDSTTAFYWGKHEKTKETLHGHWIHTGDKYYQDEEGIFWYCGRADDMLKVGGIWVSPVGVEATLIGHPAVLEAAVVGKEDTDRLVKPKAFVVLKDPHAPSPALDRVRARAAEDGHGEDPALQAPSACRVACSGLRPEASSPGGTESPGPSSRWPRSSRDRCSTGTGSSGMAKSTDKITGLLYWGNVMPGWLLQKIVGSYAEQNAGIPFEGEGETVMEARAMASNWVRSEKWRMRGWGPRMWIRRVAGP